MADPLVQYLPQLSAALGQGSLVPPVPTGGTALQRALVTGAAPIPAPTATQLQAQFNGRPALIPGAAGSPQAASPAAAAPVAPAVPVAPPAPVAATAVPAAAAGTNQSSGVPANVVLPPLPANMRAGLNADGTGPAGTPPLPGGDGTVPVIGGGSNGTAASPTPRGMVQLPAAPQFSGGGVSAAQAGGGTDDGTGLQVIRGGATTNYDATGNRVSGGSIAPRGSGLTDPQGIINSGFDTQTARAENFIQQAMDYVNQGGDIFERATRGRFINGLLQATVGPNNVGQVQGQGQDTLNSAIAGESEAATGANAQIYGAQTNFAAGENRNETALQLEGNTRSSTPVVIGQRYVDNGMGIKVPQPIYGLPTLGTNERPQGFGVINSGTGMVAPAPKTPDVTTFIQQAKAQGSKLSDTELTNYYNKTYANGQ